MSSDVIVGIDLGTTYSSVAVCEKESVKIIHNDHGHRIMPSCVSFTSNGRLIGDSALKEMRLNPKYTVYDVKRLIGRHFLDPVVQSDMKMWSFKVKSSENRRRPLIEIKENEKFNLLPPETISAMILERLKEMAENYLGKKVTRAVITVPAYFNDGQRNATIDAGVLAGLQVERIINEPTAAALAYGLNCKGDDSSTILVFDLGGGTFDVSILKIDGDIFEVLSTAGNTHLGGQDFTQRLMQQCIDEIEISMGKDIKHDEFAMVHLRESCEEAKKILSFNKTAVIRHCHGDIDHTITITQAEFENLNIDLFKKTISTVEEALNDKDINKNDIDEVILVGGSTRIPKIKELLSKFFNGKKLNTKLQPDEAVAIGAAILAGILNENEDLPQNIVFSDVIPMSLGVGINSEFATMSFILKRNTSIPVKVEKEYLTMYDNQTNVSFKLFEGENKMTCKNNFLDEFTLSNIPLGPKKTIKFTVTFSVDKNGILTVSAVEKSKGNNKKTITVQNVNDNFSREEIINMMKDMLCHEQTNIKNDLDTLRKLCRAIQLDKKLDNNDRAKISRKCNEVVRWIVNNKNCKNLEIKNIVNEISSMYKEITKQ